MLCQSFGFQPEHPNSYTVGIPLNAVETCIQERWKPHRRKVKMIPMCLKTFPLRILPLTLILFSGVIRAEEGGSGLYVPGAYSSLINITPNKPGFAIGNTFYFYHGEVGGTATLPFGLLLASGIDASIYFASINLAYTFSPTILGAHYTAAISIPYIWVEAEAKISINSPLLARTIGQQTKTVRDSANGITDMAFCPVALNWTFGDLQINPQFTVYAPTGSYNKSQLANAGQNHWMFDNVLGLSYLNHKTGTELTVFGGFAVATENQATHYLNGDIFHLEATLEQFLPLSKQDLIGIGPNFFYFQQVTGDSGSGAVLGDLKGTDMGVGPVVTLIHTSSKYVYSVQAKWLPELETRNRLRGNGVWVSAGLQW
jgi:hypothetical protein